MNVLAMVFDVASEFFVERLSQGAKKVDPFSTERPPPSTIYFLFQATEISAKTLHVVLLYYNLNIIPNTRDYTVIPGGSTASVGCLTTFEPRARRLPMPERCTVH